MRLVIWAWSTCSISYMTGSSGLAWLLRQENTLGNVTHANIVATHPLELVHLNYLCLEPGKGLDKNVLVVTDHFTRYSQAYVTRTQTTK